MLKWAWSSVFFHTGTTSSCHRTTRFKFTNGSEFHNIPEKQRDRQKMINGEWPGYGCEYCKKIEDVGGTSDRTGYTNNIHDPALIPNELEKDNTSLTATPSIVEVYFNNTCNMKCVYCGPEYSSLWDDENKRFNSKFEGHNNVPYVGDHEYSKLTQEFWNWLGQNNRAQQIQRFQVLGGEPLLLKELDDTINFWAKHGHPDLTISIISNLNVPHERFKKIISKFKLLFDNKKIWHLQLTGSLDGWGAEEEYVRSGLDLKLWEKNFNYVLETPWIVPSVNCALSSLNIKVLAPLLERINNWNKKQVGYHDGWRFNNNQIVFSFNTTTGYTDPYIFGSEVFSEDLEKILSLMPNELEHQKNYKNIMQGVATKMKHSKKDPNKIEKLTKYLDSLDARRDTNWRELFGWIEKV